MGSVPRELSCFATRVPGSRPREAEVRTGKGIVAFAVAGLRYDNSFIEFTASLHVNLALSLRPSHDLAIMSQNDKSVQTKLLAGGN